MSSLKHMTAEELQATIDHSIKQADYYEFVAANADRAMLRAEKRKQRALAKLNGVETHVFWAHKYLNEKTSKQTTWSNLTRADSK